MKKHRSTLSTLFLVFLFLFSACSTPTANATPETPGIMKHGLLAEFYNSMSFSGLPAAARVDDTVDFVSEGGYPAVGVASDFAIRWSGYLEVPAKDSYILTVLGDDKVRLIFNDETLVDDWAAPTLAEHDTRALPLEPGVRYPIRLEMADINGTAAAQLYWRTESGTMTKQIIPNSALFTSAITLPPTATPNDRPKNELCVPNLKDPDAQYLAGTPQPKNVVIPGDIASVQNLQLSATDIVGVYQPNTFRVLIVPVGYSQAEITTSIAEQVATMQSIVSQLGLQVSYAYLGKSMPAEVDKYSDFIEMDDEMLRQVVYKVRTIATPHLVVINTNVEGRGESGTIDEKYQYNINSRDYPIQSNTHELGHALWLSDGYLDSFYSYGEFYYSSTEYFLDDGSGNPIIHFPDVQEWVNANHPRFVDSGRTCLGERILKMEGATGSMMDKFWEDDQIMTNGVVNREIFTQFQLWYMNRTVGQILLSNP